MVQAFLQDARRRVAEGHAVSASQRFKASRMAKEGRHGTFLPDFHILLAFLP